MIQLEKLASIHLTRCSLKFQKQKSEPMKVDDSIEDQEEGQDKMQVKESIPSSFELNIAKRKYIAYNHLRLNAAISSIMLLLQLGPFFLPWYADTNVEIDPTGDNGSGYPFLNRNKNRTYIIFSLFSVLITDQWMPIQDFIDQKCPFILKSGFDCLDYDCF
jgi:hypothetical protein